MATHTLGVKRCGAITALILIASAVSQAQELSTGVADLGLDVRGGPVDIYLLADNTGSMSGEILDVRKNALFIFGEVSKISSDVFWGVGAYKDTGDEFVFKNILPVTPLPPDGTPEDSHPILNAIKE